MRKRSEEEEGSCMDDSDVGDESSDQSCPEGDRGWGGGALIETEWNGQSDSIQWSG